MSSAYPDAADAARVGNYPARAYAGGGFVWDEVLEYRVWCHALDGGDDYYYAFAKYQEALACSEANPGAAQPLALILQREYVDEPSDGQYVHVKEPRVTEWPVEFLRRPRRTDQTIPQFFASEAPSNRLDILRGMAPPPDKPR